MDVSGVLGVGVSLSVAGVVIWNLILMWKGRGLYSDLTPGRVSAPLMIWVAATSPSIGVMFLGFIGAILGLWHGAGGVFVMVALTIAGGVLGLAAVAFGRPRWLVPPPLRPWVGLLMPAMERARR